MSVTLAARPLALVPGVVTMTLGVAVLGVSAVALGNVGNVSLGRPSVSLGAGGGGPGAGSSGAGYGIALAQVSARPLVPVSQPVQVVLGAAVLTISGRPLTGQPGQATMSLGVAVAVVGPGLVQPISGILDPSSPPRSARVVLGRSRTAVRLGADR